MKTAVAANSCMTRKPIANRDPVTRRIPAAQTPAKVDSDAANLKERQGLPGEAVMTGDFAAGELSGGAILFRNLLLLLFELLPGSPNLGAIYHTA